MKNRLLLILLITSFNLSAQSSWDPLGDKRKHIAAGTFSGFMTSFVVYGNNGERKKNAFLWGVTSSIITGAIKELSDHNKPENTPWSDLGYNVLGGVVGSLTVNVILNRYENKHKRRLKRILKRENK